MLPVPPTNPAPSVRTQTITTPSPHTPPKKRIQPHRMTSEPAATRPTRIPRPKQAQLPDGIGKYVARDAEEVTILCCMEFVRRRKGR